MNQVFKVGDKVTYTSFGGNDLYEVVFVNGKELALRSVDDDELFVVDVSECELYTDPAVPGTNNKGVSMANNVVGQVVGGAPIALNGVSTVADVAAKLGATDRIATVNGSPADHSTVLSDNAFVMFSDKKKGGL